MAQRVRQITTGPKPELLTNAALVARAQGLSNIGAGAWPLLHLKIFERLFGPRRMVREQDWLVRTVAGLLVVNGWSQLPARPTSECLAQARRTGLGTALTLLGIDLVYVPAGKACRGHAHCGWSHP
jgi:hypothetical protein